MLVRFVGDPTEAEQGRGWSTQRIDLFGKTFDLHGAPVDCSDLPANAQRKLRNHREFVVVADLEITAIDITDAAPVAAEKAPEAPRSKRRAKTED